MAQRSVLLVGGAPRVPVDAVRFLGVHATGRTMVRLAELLDERGHADHPLLLAQDCVAAAGPRYATRAELEHQLRTWIAAHPSGAVVLSAAVNDYEIASVVSTAAGETTRYDADQKVPSGAEEVRITLRPAAKIIDQLRGWGLRGPVVGFKYEAAETVIASAQALRQRVDAAAVLANSLTGAVQALVTRTGVQAFPDDRAGVLAALADLLVRL